MSNTVKDNSSFNYITVIPESGNNITVTQPLVSVIEIATVGPQGPPGPPGSGSGGGGPFVDFGSYWGATDNLQVTGSFNTTGSVLFVSTNSSIVSNPAFASNDFFLVRNSTTAFVINNGVQITSSANNPIQVLDANNNNLLQVSQSGLIIFSTSSTTPSGTAPNGAILFTSTNFFVGLE
jgi:hypothetical protein